MAHIGGVVNDVRAKLGNDVAIKAYREGKLPFPDDTIIARLAWSCVPSEENSKPLRPILERRLSPDAAQKVLAEPFVAGPRYERSVYGQRLKKIRLDRRLGVR